MKKFIILTKMALGLVTDSEKGTKKAMWKFILQTVINILTALVTALGATSGVNAL